MSDKNIFNNISTAARTAMIKLFGLDQAFTKDGEKPNDKELSDTLNKALGQFNNNPGFASIYTSYVRAEMERKKQYKEYDSMEEESEVIATALDIYAEDATDFDNFVGSRVWITSGKDKIEAEANELLKRLKFEKNVPRIARSVGKYGDFFLGIMVDKGKDGKASEKKGIERIDTSYYPRDVMPIVRDYRLLGYWIQDAERVQTIQAEALKAPWEFVHFAIPGDANFLTYDSPMEYEMKRGDIVEYGQSLLKAARKPYKRSKLMHDILAIARITRSPLKRVFKFMTDTNNPIAQITALAMFKKTMEKIGGIDKANDSMNYDELMNVMTQDIFLPVGKDAKGDYSFETIGGEVDVKAISDIDLFDNRLFMSLRIPKEYMNFDATMGDKSTLLLKDIRYAKRVKKLQNAIRNGIRELLFIHFALQGTVLSDGDFEVNMASTSISEDLERLDYYNNAVQTADALIRMLDAFMVKVEPDLEGNPMPQEKYDRNYLAYYILKHVVKLPSFDLDKFNPAMAKYAADIEKSAKGENTRKFVEDNKGMINKMLQLRVGKELTEAAEEINTNMVKGYRTTGIPEDFAFEHDKLRSYIEGVMTKKENAASESRRVDG